MTELTKVIDTKGNTTAHYVASRCGGVLPEELCSEEVLTCTNNNAWSVAHELAFRNVDVSQFNDEILNMRNKEGISVRSFLIESKEVGELT